jgi:Flp pilus assembly protein TadB
MNDHSKFIGYFMLAVLAAAFVAWAKFAMISGAAFWIILAGTFVFFVGFRVYTGVWPGNDAAR